MLSDAGDAGRDDIDDYYMVAVGICVLINNVFIMGYSDALVIDGRTVME